MSRCFFIDDAAGRRRIDEAAFPLCIGGKEQAGIVLVDIAAEQALAYIALEGGHAYLQAATGTADIFLNNEKLMDSSWLKSGDRIQIAEHDISWTVLGEKVLIDVRHDIQNLELRAPLSPPPNTPAPGHNEMPVHTPSTSNTNGGKRRRIAAYASVISLILVAIFLLMATPVTIRIAPEAESLQMQGFPPPLSLWGSRLALPGQYTVKAERPGYLPFSQQITIVMGKAANFNYILTERPGYLRLTTTPNLSVRLMADGSELASNDQGLAEITRGTHQLQIESDRYLVHTQSIEIEGYGHTQHLDITLEPAWATVALSSIPDKAAVSIDGALIGTTPLTTDILAGQHEIVLHLEGFKPATHIMEFFAGDTPLVKPFKLQEVDAHIEIHSQPDGASILLDGIFQGVTPIKLNLAANSEHRIQLSKSGYHSADQMIVLKANESKSLNIALKAEYGTVFLSTEPADASLLIDGKPAKIQNGRLRLSAKPHAFELSKPGYITQHITITPGNGASQNIVIQLKTEQQQAAQQKAAEMPAIITSAANQTLHLIKPDTQLKMGASRRQAGRRANESRRLIALNRAFYFASKEVTNGAYRQFKAKHDSGMLDGVGLNSDPQPVVNISWEDAARYSNWLSKQQGLPEAYVEDNGKMLALQPMNTGYRLPTEAEWAWVSRHQGRSQLQRYPWSGRYPPTTIVGNYADAQIADTLADVVPGYDDGYRGSAPVGSFAAYPEGFYDIGGNVSEWVHDYYALYPGEVNILRTDPSGPANGTHHVIRGAGWRHGSISELRSSYRDYSNQPRHDLGFRIARYAE